MVDIELHEITSVISSAGLSKAAGLDNISMRLIRDNVDVLSPIMCHLFNHCLQDCVYPTSLKMAKVTPIYKDGETSDPSSYRPISVLSAINIIFEKLLAKRITSFLDKYQILSPEQHGFRSKHSTSSAIVKLTQIINTALNDNKLATVVFVDLKKAFDTVDHQILLKNYNAMDSEIKCTTSFLATLKIVIKWL